MRTRHAHVRPLRPVEFQFCAESPDVLVAADAYKPQWPPDGRDEGGNHDQQSEHATYAAPEPRVARQIHPAKEAAERGKSQQQNQHRQRQLQSAFHLPASFYLRLYR